MRGCLLLSLILKLSHLTSTLRKHVDFLVFQFDHPLFSFLLVPRENNTFHLLPYCALVYSSQESEKTAKLQP